MVHPPAALLVLTKVKRVYRRLVYLRDLCRREFRDRHRFDVPLLRRVMMWRQGFLAESVMLYQLTPRNCHLYLSDYKYHLKTTFINYGPYTPLLNDKVLFYHMMKSISASTPPVHGFVDRGRIAWLDPPPGIGGPDGLRDLILQGREIVLKPAGGGGGRGISFLSYDDRRLKVNGKARDIESLGELLTPGTVISERVHQGAYAAKIYGNATNTIRIITMWDAIGDEPFIAVAVHRFGTDRSAPLDNFGRGAFSASVDLETGELGRAVSFLYSGRLEWQTAHPDTGQPIQGTSIPNWTQVKKEILRVARALPHLVYVGWDVVVREDSLSIIEGNSYPNPRVLQVHKPLLTDPRVRDFYRRHGVLSA